MQVGGSVDDAHLIAYRTSIEANRRTLERTHKICLIWARKHGASSAPKKYELIHLTRNPKKFNMKATLDLESHQITRRAELKILGLWIHGKLRWGPHIKKVQGKTASQMMALTKVAASTWGGYIILSQTGVYRRGTSCYDIRGSVWYSPKEIRKRGTGSGAKLAVFAE